jgi:hypothetical protein
VRKRLLVVLVAAVVGLAGCGTPKKAVRAPRTTIAPMTTTTGPLPSAADQLAGFVGAARQMDAQLDHAATLINGIGPPWTPPWPTSVVSAVEAADLRPVAAAIPAGLPSDLLRRTIVVYSDLASRYYAMRWFGAEGFPYEEPSDQMQGALLAALANGAPAAARFAADVDGLVGAARRLPPFAAAAPASRQAADVLLLVQWVDGMNGGCASTGGAVITTLPVIAWTPHDNASGTIAGVAFNATLVGGAWEVTILAC